MADGESAATTVTPPPASGRGDATGKNDCGDRREFQFLIGGALLGVLALRGYIGYVLLHLPAQPPDWAYQLIADTFKHFDAIGLGLMGGLLGMATARRMNGGT